MVIKGPRSALTDFIEEQKIDIKKLKLLAETKKEEQNIKLIEKQKIVKRKIKNKQSKYGHGMKEMINIDKTGIYDSFFETFLKNNEIYIKENKIINSENKIIDSENKMIDSENKMINSENKMINFYFENSFFSDFIGNDQNPKQNFLKSHSLINKNASNNLYFEKIQFTSKDHFFDEFSKFLSRKRLMNHDFYNFILKNCDKKFCIYDCSTIRNFHLKESLTHVELHTCGQMSDTSFLDCCSNIEKLKITGAFRIKKINLPENLKILDISFCTNISDDFFEDINKNKQIEELVLNHCYGLRNPPLKMSLKKSLKRVYLNETLIDETFIESLGPNLEELSISKCKNIFPIENANKTIKKKKLLKFNQKSGLLDLSAFKKLKILNIEGISTIKKLILPQSIEILNLNYCFGIQEIPKFCNLKELKISGLDIENLEQIIKLKKLKKLDLSWNRYLSHELLVSLVSSLDLDEICVFGCFGLTAESGKFVYENPKKTRIFGCPYETNFLMNK
ncbi:hypothetical protein DMUE_3488 [Dictyocoela muelleri]|nr:hypothetical protein DMUE_3488 [Dictyocoela muelleri]